MNVRSSRDWLGEETQHGFSFSARCWVNLVEIASAARPAASASRPNVSPARLRLLPTRPTAASSRTMSVLRCGPCEASRRVHFQCIEPAIKAGAQCAFLLHVQPCQQPSAHFRVGFGVKGKGLAHSLPRCMSRSHMRNLALLRWAEVLCLLVACPNHLEPSLSGGDQPVRAGRPFERLRLLLVVQRDELPASAVLGVAADDRPVQNVQRGEQPLEHAAARLAAEPGIDRGPFSEALRRARHLQPFSRTYRTALMKSMVEIRTFPR